VRKYLIKFNSGNPIQFKSSITFAGESNKSTGAMSMEMVAYIFFGLLFVASFIVGKWLDDAEKDRLKNKIQ
jgi:hypothetical protein